MSVIKVLGKVALPGHGAGARDFTRRMTDFPHIFKEATGEDLFLGTLNIEIERNQALPIREHFRI